MREIEVYDRVRVVQNRIVPNYLVGRAGTVVADVRSEKLYLVRFEGRDDLHSGQLSHKWEWMMTESEALLIPRDKWFFQRHHIELIEEAA